MESLSSFLKIFFAAAFLYSCSGAHNGPYAYIDVMPRVPSSSLLNPDTASKDLNKEVARVRAEIFSPHLLEKTLRAFQETDLTAQTIKDDLVVEDIENTSIIRIRFYSDKEAFSRAFLDSLVKNYVQYRSNALKQAQDREIAGVNKLLDVLEDTLMLYEDSLNDLGKKFPGAFIFSRVESIWSKMEGDLARNEMDQRIYSAIKTSIEKNALDDLLAMAAGQDDFLTLQLKTLLLLKKESDDHLLRGSKEDKTYQELVAKQSSIKKDLLKYLSNCLNALQERDKKIRSEMKKTLTEHSVRPEQKIYQRLLLAVNRLEKEYTYLLQHRADKMILAAGNNYTLYVLEHARYRSSEGKNF